MLGCGEQLLSIVSISRRSVRRDGSVEVRFVSVDAPSGWACWWRAERGHDCGDVTTMIEHGDRHGFLACEQHRLEVADLLSRHTDCVLMSG